MACSACSSEAGTVTSSCRRKVINTAKKDYNNVAIISSNPRQSLKCLKIGLSTPQPSLASELSNIKALKEELIFCKQASTFFAFILSPCVWDETENASSAMPTGKNDMKEDDSHDLLEVLHSSIFEAHRHFLVDSSIKPRDYKFKAYLVIRDCESPQTELMANTIMRLRIDMPIERLCRIIIAIIPSGLQLWFLQEILVLFEHNYSNSECFKAASATLQNHQSLVLRGLQNIGDELESKSGTSYRDDSLVTALAIVCHDNNFPCIILSSIDEIKKENVSKAVEFVTQNLTIPENVSTELGPSSWSFMNIEPR